MRSLLADDATDVAQVAASDEERVMTMIEVRAERQGRRPHNFAAFLARVDDGRIWMVDARPAYGDEFRS